MKDNYNKKLMIIATIIIAIVGLINILAVAYVFITDYQCAIDTLGGLF